MASRGRVGPAGRSREAPAVVAPAGPGLIGRARHLAVLDATLDQVVSGCLRVALITGDAGVGKTRLAAEVVARDADSFTCLASRSYRWGTSASFGPWVEALDRYLRGRARAEVRELCGPALPDLAVLLTSVAGAAPASITTGPEPLRARLLEGLVEVLARLSAERPVLVTLDDLHLADRSSWEALRYLGRRLASAPIGVLVTARPAELKEREIAGEVLVGLADDGLLDRVEVEPLTRADVAELAHEVLRGDSRAPTTFVTAPLVTWLADRSLGHPLFVIGLLEALLEEGGDPASPRLEHLPASLRDRVALELHAFTPADRDVLEVLAVVDRCVEADDVVRISGRPAEEVARVLERLSRSRLVAEQRRATRPGYEIAHPIVQEAIYDGIGGARVQLIHREVARALQDGGQLGAAAGHFARAGGPADAEAVAALCAAMAQAEERGLYREALATLEALLDLLPADDDRWLQVLDTMDWQPEWVLSHLAENDADVAIAAMQRMERHLRGSADTAARATVEFHLAAFLSFGAGRVDEAEQACRSAADLFRAAGEEERTLLARNELAWLRGCGGRLEEQADIAVEVLREAESQNQRRAAVQAAGTAAYALGFLGRFDEAHELYRRAIAEASQEGNTYRVAWGYAQQGCMLGLAGALEQATRSVEAAMEADPSAPDAIAYEDLAHCHWLAGRLEDGLEALDRSATRRPLRGSRRRAWGGALAARLHLEAGRPERARSCLEQVRGTYRETFLVWSFWEDWAQAMATWHEDGPASAVAPLGRVARHLAAIGAAAYEPLVLLDLAEAAAEIGDVERAEVAADRIHALAATTDGTLAPALGRLARAYASSAGGRREVAAEDAREADAELRRRGYLLLSAMARRLVGQATADVDRGAAIDALRSAVELFERCGARWRRDATLAELAGLGSRGRRAAAAARGPTSLTPRERQVALLAAQGYSARQIGEQLFIGRRTVETHLANCYAKLGISSRGELIRRSEELEPPDAGGP